MLTFRTTVKTVEHVIIELALVILFPLTQDHNIIHGAQFLNVTSNYQPHLTHFIYAVIWKVSDWKKMDQIDIRYQ